MLIRADGRFTTRFRRSRCRERSFANFAMRPRKTRTAEGQSKHTLVICLCIQRGGNNSQRGSPIAVLDRWWNGSALQE
jgi:hypothetical protein